MNIIVNLNKHKGITSQDAVTSVKRLLKVRKAGHAGTLDPLATGILLVCLNEATKITGYLSALEKEYAATIKLGETTDTYDSEGRIVRTVKDFKLSADEIKEVFKQFTGDIEQIPPMYSAIKLNGKPLYKLARQGIEVIPKKRTVSIYSIELLNYESPFITLLVACSKGTYIRSLCNDIGSELGTGAHITGLKRTKIGGFTIENSAKIEELPEKKESLCSIDYALSHLPEIRLFDGELQRIKNGNPMVLEAVKSSNLTTETYSSPAFTRLKDSDGKIFGIGRVSDGCIKPERLFNLGIS